MSTSIRVYETEDEAKAGKERDAAGKPAHWVDGKACAFQNPWPSWHLNSARETFSMLMDISRHSPVIPGNIDDIIPVRTPTFGLGETELENTTNIKATWLGHACFLVELPTRPVGALSLSRGPRILFDPAFSDRCSPSQWIGPKRYTPPPCDIESIPEVDAIVISHNHYDHLDTHTIRTLFRRARMPHIFAPLGNAAYFRSLEIPESHTHIMDWWQSRRVETEIIVHDNKTGESSVQKTAFDVTCTPGQHFTGRGILDRFKSLWAGWVVEEVLRSRPSEVESSSGVKVYFAGDTGYRAVLNGQDEDQVPTCPVFKEIGKRFGGFDFAMIPIGAYKPRHYMSSIHCAPQDSVRLFKDVQAKRALGMHWGTWVLTNEEIWEPPKRLAEECHKIGIEEGAFTVCDIGETKFF